MSQRATEAMHNAFYKQGVCVCVCVCVSFPSVTPMRQNERGQFDWTGAWRTADIGGQIG